MSIGAWYHDDLLKLSNDDLRHVFKYPEHVRELEVQLIDYSAIPSPGCSFTFHVYPTRIPVDYLMTGDNVVGMFVDRASRDDAARKFIDRLRQIYPVKVYPFEKICVQSSKNIFSEYQEEPIDVNTLERRGKSDE